MLNLKEGVYSCASGQIRYTPPGLDGRTHDSKTFCGF